MSRAVIIGGGVIGLCSAYSLAKKGFDVTVIDPEDGPRTSEVNAGMIVPSHIIPLAAPGMVGVGLRMMFRPKSPFRIRPGKGMLKWCLLFARSCTPENVERSKKLLIQLNGASKQAYLEFQNELDGFQVEQKGLLMIAAKESSLEEEKHVATQVRTLGLPAEVLDSKQVAEIDPGVRIEAAGGVHYVADCHFSPPVFMAALRKRLDEMGVEFISARVTEMGRGRSTGVPPMFQETTRTVQTTSGEIAGDEFVLAAGAWSSRFAVDLPLQAGKGYSINVPDPPARPSIPAILMEGRVAVTPMPNGAVRFGGTMEIGPPDDRIDLRRVQGIREAIPNYYPAFGGVDLSPHPVGVGLRPCSPDGLPYIGRIDNCIVATGHAMMGMSLGPITGRLVAQLAAGEEPEIDISRLAPDRFS